jgi:3-phenylpropionate/trans-cinnamate dioxygenase ferredoxin reductase component
VPTRWPASQPLVTGRHVVVVGGSLAGVRAAGAIRAGGFDGRLTIVGEEPHQPYDRPPLSKHVLAGTRAPEQAQLNLPEDLGAEWRLGVRAISLDVAGRRVELDDGEALEFDGVVLATGAVPRRVPGWPELDGVHVLRTLDHCAALRAELQAGPRRVLVVGAGFIGCEVAATARGLGVEVTVVEPLSAPCVRGLGEAMGAFVADLHRANGVDLRLGAVVERLHGSRRAEGALLADGSVVDADVVVVGVGVSPATGWLEGSGLALDDGVVCDATCSAAPGVVAAGDVARWHHPFHGSMRVEHWENAVDQGAHAGRTLLAHLAGGTGAPFAPVPWFWSDQYDRKLQLAGRPTPDCTVSVVDGSVEDRRFVATYERRGEVVAALAVNMPPKLVKWRQALVAAQEQALNGG